MSGRTFYTLAVGFSSGIFLRSIFDIGIAAAGALVVFAAALALLWRVRSGAYTSALFLLSLLCLCAAVGVMRYDISTWHERNDTFDERIDQEVALEGVIVREVDERARTAQLTVRAAVLDGIPVDERVLVIADRFPEFQYGDRVRVTGTLSLPDTFETELGRTFDYPGYLSVRGITYTLPFADVEHIGGNKEMRGGGAPGPPRPVPPRICSRSSMRSWNVSKHSFPNRRRGLPKGWCLA